MKTLICGLWHVHAESYYRTAADFGEIVGVMTRTKREGRHSAKDSVCVNCKVPMKCSTAAPIPPSYAPPPIPTPK